MFTSSKQWLADGYISCFSIGSEFVCIALEYVDTPVLKLWSKKAFQTSGLTLSSPAEMELIKHRDPIRCLALYSADGTCDSIICSASDEMIVIWRIDEDLRVVPSVLVDNLRVETSAMTFDATGTLIALAQETCLEVVQVSSGGLYVRLEGHTANITECKFHPTECHVLITTSEDRTFKIWDLAERTLLYQSSVLSASAIISMQINPRNHRLCIGFADGKLRVFDMDTLTYAKEIAMIDVAKFIRKKKQLEERKAKMEESMAAAPPVVSSLPSWAKSEQAKEADHIKKTIKRGLLPEELENAEDDHSIELACSILQLGFIGQRNSFNDHFTEANQKKKTRGFQVEEEVELFCAKQWIIVGTNSYMFLVNAHTYEIQMLQDLQKPILCHIPDEIQDNNCEEDKNRGQTGIVIRFAKAMVFDNSFCSTKAQCGIISAFDPCFTSVCITGEDGIVGAPEKAEAKLPVVSVFPRNPPPEASVLLKTLGDPCAQPKEMPRKGSKALADKPITFRTKVKSSGYGKGPPPIPLGGRSNSANKKKKKPPARSNNFNKEYPVECNLIKNYQPRNALPQDALRMGPINCIEFSKDARNLVVGANNNSVQSLQLPFSKYRGDGSAFLGHNAPIRSAHWSHNTSLIVSTARDGSARVWHADFDDPLLLLKPGETRPRSRNSEFSVSRRNEVKGIQASDEIAEAMFYYLDKFITVVSKNSVYVYQYQIDLEKHKKRQDDIKRHYAPNHISKIVAKWMHPNSKSITASVCNNSFLSHLLVTAGSDKTIMLFDTANGKPIRVIEDAHSRAVHSLCFPTSSAYVSHPSSCYEMLLSAAPDNSIHLWDLRSCSVGMRFGEHVNRVHRTGVAFSPCMRYIATGSEDKVCYVYDIRTGRYLEKLHGHADVVSSVAYNPLHPQLATASFDGRIRFHTDVA